MKAIKVFITVCLCMLFSMTLLQAASISPKPLLIQADTILPKVFLIGDYESQYEQALIEHETLLLTACEFSMDLAYDKWMSMLREMEAYANDINFDLKGTKLWLNVFWEKDGTLKHVAYYLKPISRNIDTAELSAFFSSFMNNYTFPLVTDKRYSHYGSASFPLFPVRIEEDKKKTISDRTTRNR